MDFLFSFGYSVFFWLKNRTFRRDNVFFKIRSQYVYWFDYWVQTRYIDYLSKKVSTKKFKIGANRNIIASLTSFPTRINYTWIAVATILNQTFPCDKVILWLAQEQFPDCNLPENLKKLQQCGLEIRFCDDLRSHKKYYYAMQEFPESVIITFDDDLIYPRDTVKKLLKTSKRFPDDIVCITAQQISGKRDLPSKWFAPVIKGESYFHRDDLQAYTGTGTLFPVGAIDQRAFDKEAIKKNAPYADDLWLKAMSYIKGVKTTQITPRRKFPLEVKIKNNQTLFKRNGLQGENLNDKQWESILNNYFYE